MQLWIGVAIAVVMIVAFFGYWYWLAFKEPAWLVYPNPELHTINPVVVAGSTLAVTAIRLNTSDHKRSYTTARDLHCDAFKKPILLDGKVVDIEAGLTSVPAFHLIPDTVVMNTFGPLVPMPTTICWIDGSSEINGTIRTSTVPWHTNKFKVLSKADAAAGDQ